MSDPKTKDRNAWLRTLLQWHWISSAICLIGLLGFSVTGFTLNHAGEIEAKPAVHNQTGTLTPDLLKLLDTSPAAKKDKANAPLPPAVRDKLMAETSLRWPAETEAEWSPDEVYLPLPRPGGDAWLRIDRHEGSFEAELTDRGWLAYFNDLHKGRHTGTAWRWFIDLLAIGCCLFALTGLLILQIHARHRALTWPLVGAGLLLPALVALLLMH